LICFIRFKFLVLFSFVVSKKASRFWREAFAIFW
jgi:hypothetical protein